LRDGGSPVYHSQYVIIRRVIRRRLSIFDGIYLCYLIIRPEEPGNPPFEGYLSPLI
jgi:hypothetical protein